MLALSVLLIACAIFVHALSRTSGLNTQLRVREQRPMRNVGPVVAFLFFFVAGLFYGLILVDFFVIYRNRKARKLITAGP